MVSKNFKAFEELDGYLEQLLLLPLSERSLFLRQLERDRPEFRSAVSRLLDAAESDDSLLNDGPALHQLASRFLADGSRGSTLTSTTAALDLGRAFGAYQVVSSIGSGGMGQVYRARDEKLARDVALKLLPPEFVGDAERLARFEREARLLATLNHANITAIYEIEEHNDVQALVLELVEGETLEERLASGPILFEEALDLGIQIARALEAAHDKGVLHRDLKPANIKVTPGGEVKVLDFGLAKSLRPEGSEGLTRAQTLNEMTKEGRVLGTAPYMSPEQWKGQAANQQSDVWAFGCVLYEMLSGRRPFVGSSTAEVTAAILERQPDWSRLGPEVPDQIGTMLERCLAKAPENRPAGASELRALLESLSSGTAEISYGRTPHSVGDESSRRPQAGPFRRMAAAMSGLAVLTIAGFYLSRGVASSTSLIDSVAVLPFTYEGSEDEAFLRDGVEGVLINSLAKIDGLRTVPRSVSQRYRNGAADPIGVAQELGVRSVVTGRLTEHNGRMVVAVELTDVDLVSQLWGERYERSSDQLLSVQRELTDGVLLALRPDLPHPEHSEITDFQTENPEAWSLYLKARYLTNLHDPINAEKALEFAYRAVESDPEFAPAWWAVGHAEDNARHLGVTPYHPGGERQRKAAERALEIIPDSARGLAELGFYHYWLFELEQAERTLRRALELDPEEGEALDGLGAVLITLDRPDQCEAPIQASLTLDPTNPTRIQRLARCYITGERYDEAYDLYREIFELNPERDSDRGQLALFLSGRHDEAIGLLREQLAETDGDPTTSPTLAIYLAASGDAEGAQQILERLPDVLPFDRLANGMHPRYLDLEGGDLGWGQSVDRALALAYLGEMDDAMTILEAVVAERAGVIPWKVPREWDVLRSNPRFQKLWRSHGLVPSRWTESGSDL